MQTNESTSIRLRCNSCNQPLTAPSDLIGRKMPCPKCSAEIFIEEPKRLIEPPGEPPREVPEQEIAELVNVSIKTKPTSMQDESIDPRILFATYTWNVRAAGVLSFFIVGLGQVYKGDIERGLFLLFSYMVSIGLAILTLGSAGPSTANGFIALTCLLFALILWLFGIYDATAVPRTQLGNLLFGRRKVSRPEKSVHHAAP